MTQLLCTLDQVRKNKIVDAEQNPAPPANDEPLTDDEADDAMAEEDEA